MFLLKNVLTRFPENRFHGHVFESTKNDKSLLTTESCSTVVTWS